MHAAEPQRRPTPRLPRDMHPRRPLDELLAEYYRQFHAGVLASTAAVACLAFGGLGCLTIRVLDPGRGGVLTYMVVMAVAFLGYLGVTVLYRGLGSLFNPMGRRATEFARVREEAEAAHLAHYGRRLRVTEILHPGPETTLRRTFWWAFLTTVCLMLVWGIVMVAALIARL